MKNAYFFAGLFAFSALWLCVSCDSDTPEMPGDDDVPTETPATSPEDGKPEPADMPEANFPSEFEALTAEVRPMLTDGKRWLMRCSSDRTPEGYEDAWFRIEESTVFDGAPAVRVNVKAAYGDGIYLKENNGAVFATFWNWTDFDPDFKWDYVLDIEASLPKYSSYNFGLIPMSKGTIKLMGKTLRAVKLYVTHHAAPGIPYEYWIEGIGGIKGYTMRHPEESFVSVKNPHIRIGDMLLCYDGDELIYDYREFSPDRYEPTEIFTSDYDGLPED